MKLTRTLALLFILTLVPRGLSAQYSPYYFYDSLKDDGVQSLEHYDNLGKIFLDVQPDYDIINDSAGVQTAKGNASIQARVYLKRSLKYYYLKNLYDTTYNPKDWDYLKYKPNVKMPPHWVETTSLAFFVCVIICNGDTVATWRMVAHNTEFTSKTYFEMPFWNSSMSASDDTYYYPLADYVGKKKLTGTHEISMYVYPGKIQCNSVNDRGHECLAEGKIKIQITEENLKELLDQKFIKKLEFPACEWGNNLVKLEKIK